MKSLRMILIVLTILAGGARPAEPEEKQQVLPITFARGGQSVEAAVEPRGNREVPKEAVLTAFGRTWTAPATIRNGLASIKVPSVRVPTLFMVVSAVSTEEAFGRLLVYPDRYAEWDRKIKLYASGAPTWFDQWVLAAGLPVERKPLADIPAESRGAAKPNDEGSLIIVGAESAGATPGDVIKAAADKKRNILVLEAAWFGERAAASVAPRQMGTSLAEVGRQTWPQPLEFAACRAPWPGAANRWAWITHDGGPLVEAVAFAGGSNQEGGTVLLNYVPWQEQLGLRDVADLTLLALLRAAAGARGTLNHPYGTSDVEFVYPPPTPPRTPMEAPSPPNRPVLSDIVTLPPIPKDNISPLVMIVDFRGADALAPEVLAKLEALESRVKRARLLILGDDRLLDDWKWLRLDRAKKTIGYPGVTWIPDDELPPSSKTRIELMLKLTELGVPLGSLPEER